MSKTCVVVEAEFEFPLRAGYEYITDLRRWGDYWPDFIRLAPESRWSEPGDTARLTLKLLGRRTELVMTLSRIVPYRLIEYTSVQRGLPPARHERHFAEHPSGGFGYRIVIEIEPRRGLWRPFDRLLVPRAVARAARQTVAGLERRFGEIAS
jgi:hypothetical protein